jgi:peroxisomal trans-2-enoyl-CoA reductase
VAVVTGGGTGIGLQITRELLELGCSVVISSRNAQKLAVAVEALRPVAAAGGGRVEYVVCNIRQEQQVDVLFDRTVELCGRLDILVNNGGGQFPAPASMISLKGWSAVIETNLTGTFLCCKAAHAAWMGEHGGCIVNIIADMVRFAAQRRPPHTPLPSQGFATDPPSSFALHRNSAQPHSGRGE